MILNEKHKIVVIGAGNLASHLVPALQKKGYKIVQVYSRSVESAGKLGNRLKTEFINNLAELNYSADIFLFTVTDDVLPHLLKKIHFSNQLLIHTSGSLPVSVFESFAENYGVLYPFQTFTKQRDVLLNEVPFLVEASNPKMLKILLEMAGKLSRNISQVSSEDRMVIHLAGVFACNFSNHMFAIAESIVRKHNLDFRLLKPIILETARKIQDISPVEAQTGPAVREDKKILEQHIKLLEGSPELQKMYTFVSNSIIDLKKQSKSG